MGVQGGREGTTGGFAMLGWLWSLGFMCCATRGGPAWWSTRGAGAVRPLDGAATIAGKSVC